MKEKLDGTKVFKFLMNEILPRIRKNNLNLEQLDPIIGNYCLTLEQEGILTRRDTRVILDHYIDKLVKEREDGRAN